MGCVCDGLQASDTRRCYSDQGGPDATALQCSDLWSRACWCFTAPTEFAVVRCPPRFAASGETTLPPWALHTMPYAGGSAHFEEDRWGGISGQRLARISAGTAPARSRCCATHSARPEQRWSPGSVENGMSGHRFAPMTGRYGFDTWMSAAAD